MAAHFNTSYAPKSRRSAAPLLQHKDNISPHVAEVQVRTGKRVTERRAVTRPNILAELAKIAQAPLGDEHVTVANKRAACMAYARIEGWVGKCHEHGQPGEFTHIEAMTPDVRKVHAAELLERLRLRNYATRSATGVISAPNKLPNDLAWASSKVRL